MRRRTARWVEYDGFGGTEVLRLTEGPVPVPGPGEVLVQVVTAGLNHLDAYVRRGDVDALSAAFPVRQGTCFAGIVLAAGAEVQGLPVGAEVLGRDPAHGAQATHVVVPAGAVVRKPASVPWEVAGGLFLAGTTALSIVQSLRIGSGEVVVVTAAAGGVGHIECQLARLAGATVIGVAGRDNHDFLRSIGVVPVAHGDRVEERIREAAKGRPIVALIDNFDGYEAIAASLGVPPGGVIPSSRRGELERRFRVAGGEDAEVRMLLVDLTELLATRGIRVLVSGFYAFEQLAEASDLLERRHSRGKVVVGMRTTAPAASYLTTRLRTVHERAS